MIIVILILGCHTPEETYNQTDEEIENDEGVIPGNRVLELENNYSFKALSLSPDYDNVYVGGYIEGIDIYSCF